MSEQIIVTPIFETLTVEETGQVLVVVEEQVEIVSVGVMGPPGATGAGAVEINNFAWGDATPALLLTVAANKRVYRVRLIIETPFNGTGAQLQVGSTADPDELMGITENDPGSEGTYETYPDKRYLAITPLYLTITPGAGASAGAGQVHLEIEP
jgi:hypothetical protein